MVSAGHQRPSGKVTKLTWTGGNLESLVKASAKLLDNATKETELLLMAKRSGSGPASLQDITPLITALTAKHKELLAAQAALSGGYGKAGITEEAAKELVRVKTTLMVVEKVLNAQIKIIRERGTEGTLSQEISEQEAKIAGYQAMLDKGQTQLDGSVSVRILQKQVRKEIEQLKKELEWEQGRGVDAPKVRWIDRLWGEGSKGVRKLLKTCSEGVTIVSSRVLSPSKDSTPQAQPLHEQIRALEGALKEARTQILNGYDSWSQSTRKNVNKNYARVEAKLTTLKAQSETLALSVADVDEARLKMVEHSNEKRRPGALQVLGRIEAFKGVMTSIRQTLTNDDLKQLLKLNSKEKASRLKLVNGTEGSVTLANGGERQQVKGILAKSLGSVSRAVVQNDPKEWIYNELQVFNTMWQSLSDADKQNFINNDDLGPLLRVLGPIHLLEENTVPADLSQLLATNTQHTGGGFRVLSQLTTITTGLETQETIKEELVKNSAGLILLSEAEAEMEAHLAGLRPLGDKQNEKVIRSLLAKSLASVELYEMMGEADKLKGAERTLQKIVSGLSDDERTSFCNAGDFGIFYQKYLSDPQVHARLKTLEAEQARELPRLDVARGRWEMTNQLAQMKQGKQRGGVQVLHRIQAFEDMRNQLRSDLAIRGSLLLDHAPSVASLPLKDQFKELLAMQLAEIRLDFMSGLREEMVIDSIDQFKAMWGDVTPQNRTPLMEDDDLGPILKQFLPAIDAVQPGTVPKNLPQLLATQSTHKGAGFEVLRALTTLSDTEDTLKSELVASADLQPSRPELKMETRLLGFRLESDKLEEKDQMAVRGLLAKKLANVELQTLQGRNIRNAMADFKSVWNGLHPKERDTLLQDLEIAPALEAVLRQLPITKPADLPATPANADSLEDWAQYYDSLAKSGRLLQNDLELAKWHDDFEVLRELIIGYEVFKGRAVDLLADEAENANYAELSKDDWTEDVVDYLEARAKFLYYFSSSPEERSAAEELIKNTLRWRGLHDAGLA